MYNIPMYNMDMESFTDWILVHICMVFSNVAFSFCLKNDKKKIIHADKTERETD